MKQFFTYITGVLLLQPFVICLVSNSLPLFIFGAFYLIVLKKITTPKSRRGFLRANIRLSNMLGGR